MSTATKKKTKQKSKPGAPEKKKADVATEDRRARLGSKFVCYSCKTRFYDMNKPEPLCPKCGSDQRLRPKDTEGAPVAPPPRKATPRPMPAALLEDEEEAVPFEEEMDIDIADLEASGDSLFEDDSETPEPAEDDTEET